jgi:hypothetical protein
MGARAGLGRGGGGLAGPFGRLVGPVGSASFFFVLFFFPHLKMHLSTQNKSEKCK